MSKTFVLVASMLFVCFTIEAQTLDLNYASDGVLNSLNGYHSRTHLMQTKMTVAISDYDGSNVRIRSYNEDGSPNVAFQNIGNYIPFQNVGQSNTSNLKLSEINTEEYIYLGYMERVYEDFSDNDSYRCGIARFTSSGALSTDFGTEGTIDYLITAEDYMAWEDKHLGIAIENDVLASVGWYRNVWDSLAIIQTDLDGEPNATFGNNGVAKYKISDLIQTGYSYQPLSWAFVNGECYVLVKGTINGGIEYFGKIIRIDTSGNLVGSPIDVTSYFISNVSPTFSYKQGNFYLKTLNAVVKVDLSGETGQTITSYNYQTGWYHDFVVDENQNHFLLGSTNGPAPYIGICYKYFGNGEIDGAFGQDGILSYYLDTDVDGVMFANAMFIDDVMYISCEVGDIATPDGLQNVAILKYNYSNPNSVLEQTGAGLSIFPNPALNELSLLNVKEGFVEIFSHDGRLVQSDQITNRTELHRMDISQLATGAYILKYRDSEQIQTVKFMRQ